MPRNRWPDQIGMGGRIKSESLAGCPRNAHFSREAFRVTRGEPKYFKSSKSAERGFCADCGSPLIMSVFESENIAIMVGSLDRPHDAQPRKHMGIESQIPWLAIDDDLPRMTTDEVYPAAD